MTFRIAYVPGMWLAYGLGIVRWGNSHAEAEARWRTAYYRRTNP